MGDQAWKTFCDSSLPPYTHDCKGREIKVGDTVRFTSLAEAAGYFGVWLVEETPAIGEVDLAIVMEDEFRPFFVLQRPWQRKSKSKKVAAHQGWLEVLDIKFKGA